MQAYDFRAGFTLIELMVVVAIVGLLASIAIPQYQDYSVRARMTEGVQMLAAARISVIEYFLTKGEMPKNATEAGLVTLETALVKNLTYAQADKNTATLSVEVHNTGSADADGKFFSMVGRNASGVVTWLCRPGDEAGPSSRAVPVHLLPGSCRG